ncbi:hypothetical protein BKA59DRAFT_459585 [Fusarium tricinctum]|uniref:Secreted protein n=1 Tax=Fusarium tricinctum TaxID=61284 RepID=A0A8K0RNG6_9HYPO|nr:hypothetical protein BKA59DRAFT_459585 [Fusarium tricinctum]
MAFKTFRALLISSLSGASLGPQDNREVNGTTGCQSDCQWQAMVVWLPVILDQFRVQIHLKAPTYLSCRCTASAGRGSDDDVSSVLTLSTHSPQLTRSNMK